MSSGRLAWAHRPSHEGSIALSLVVRAQHHPEGVSPSLPTPRGCCISQGQGQRLHGECSWGEIPRKPGSELGHRNDPLWGWPGGSEHGVWVRNESRFCSFGGVACGKSLKLKLWALASSFVKGE